MYLRTKVGSFAWTNDDCIFRHFGEDSSCIAVVNCIVTDIESISAAGM